MANLSIPFPAELRPRLPTILGNVDYLTLQRQLQQIDSFLIRAGIETEFVERALGSWLQRSSEEVSARQQQDFQLRSRRALRCNILRTLLQEDFRGFTCQLAGNPLYQWFCCIDAFDQVRVPSKSELHRFAHWADAEQMRAVINRLLEGAIQQPKKFKLREPVDIEDYFLDTTCLKANIHFPVDWVLLRDAVRTLMKATKLIRREGLKGRMERPEEFLRRINRLSMQMTHSNRKSGSRKARKGILRKMKKLTKIVAQHARRHRQLLDEQWDQTSWTRKQAEQVLKRIDAVLELLPGAQKQAHERIIGGRQVDNAQKILSLYDLNVRVLTRGKAGAEVEFGNTVLLGENKQGIILDYQIWKDQAPADVHTLVDSLERVVLQLKCPISGVAADRGFASKANSLGLKESQIFDAICPKDPRELKERMKSKRFAAMQKRRSQTEARISIMQRGFLGQPMRAKGFEHRQLALAWGVLTHNLWILARLVKKQRQISRKLALAA